MAYDERLAQRIRQALKSRPDVTERKMFGGLTFLLNGRMCCGIVGKDLMVRVAGDEFEAVMRHPHVRPMNFTGRPLRGFVYVSPPGFRTPAGLRSWLLRGERFVRQNDRVRPKRPRERLRALAAGKPPLGRRRELSTRGRREKG